MLHLSIRKAQESDAPAIAQIFRELGWFAWLNATPHEKPVRQIEQQIARCHADDSHSMYVAEKTPNSANHTNITHCFLTNDVERVANSKLNTTEELDAFLLPL